MWCIPMVSGGDILQLERINGRGETVLAILDDVERYPRSIMWIRQFHAGWDLKKAYGKKYRSIELIGISS